MTARRTRTRKYMNVCRKTLLHLPSNGCFKASSRHAGLKQFLKHLLADPNEGLELLSKADEDNLGQTATC